MPTTTPPPPSGPRSVIPLSEDLQFPGPDEPVLMHDDFRQIVRDVAGGLDGMELLSHLLRTGNLEGPELNTGPGLSVLMEGVRMRLQLSLDALADAADVLGIDMADPSQNP